MTDERTDDPITPEVIDPPVEAPSAPAAADTERPEGAPTVTEPSKLMRIASMTRAMLDEVRQAPLDEPGRKRLVRIYEGSLDELKEALSDELKETDEVKSAIAALELAETPVDEGEIAELKQKVEANPDDFEARMQLAEKLNAAGRRAEAMEQLLAIIEKDRSWNDEAARKQLLKFFEAWGPSDPMTVEGRKKLSAILFS